MDELKEISQYSVRTLDIIDRVTKTYHSQLKSILRDLKMRFQNVDFNIQVRMGIPFIEIIQCAREERSDFIVIDTHRNNKTNSCQRGSTTLHLMRKSEIPIWSTTRKPHSSNKVLAAVDLDEQVSKTLCHKIVRAAYDLCKVTNSELILCHIWELESEGFLRRWSGYTDSDIAYLTDKMRSERIRKIDALVEEVIEDYGRVNVKVNTKLVEGNAKDLLPRIIGQKCVDVTFLGSMSRTGIAGYLMGNKAEYWLNDLDTTVVTLKPDEFVSPINPDSR